MNPADICIALKVSDIADLYRQGKIVAILDLDSGFDLDGDLGVLRMLYRLGLRSFYLPAHNWGNDFADSCCARPKADGLSAHGREVVREACHVRD